MKWAAKLGILPRKLVSCPTSVCPSCMYDKQKQRPLQTKGQSTGCVKKSYKPGDLMVFVNHCLDVDYVHLQESTSAEETIKAKKPFEEYCSSCRVQVWRYHTDNSIFASTGFQKAVNQANQTTSFCSVRAHHQNAVAEQRIQELSD